MRRHLLQRLGNLRQVLQGRSRLQAMLQEVTVEKSNRRGASRHGDFFLLAQVVIYPAVKIWFHPPGE
jgi:hypothetical protein